MPLPTDTVDAAGAPGRDSYVDARRRLVRQRLRWTGLLALVPISLAAAVNGLVFSDRLPEHLATLGLQAACCLVGAALSWHRSAQRYAVVYTVAMALAVATSQLWAVALAARDADILVGSIIVVMMATTLLYPWGLLPQALVATYVAAGYLLLPEWRTLDTARAANILLAVTLGAGLSTCGAWILDRQRRATFVSRERVVALAHQRELLLASGPQLNATVDLEHLVPLIARLGQRIVDSDAANLTIIDDEVRDSYRVVRAVRGRPDVDEIDLPVRGTLAFREAILARHTLELPSGTEFDHLARVGPEGRRRFLIVAVQREGRLLGILGFEQRTHDDRRFSEQQTRLAEGLAHQAAIALANARLVADLQRANRIKSEFVSTMSHELRTPLNVILGFAEIGRDAAVSDVERGDCLAKIDAAGRDLLDLIESTLAIGKLEAGRDTPQVETVVLPEFWTALHAGCTRMPRHPAVVLEWSAAPARTLRTDPRKLTILLRNLVSNALKFTETGHVRVTVAAEGDRLAFRVADTGIGIRPEDRDAIFEIFRQGDGSDSRRFGGTGLGLYIVRRYVDQLGGAIDVASAPGGGSTFSVRLPYEATPARRAA